MLVKIKLPIFNGIDKTGYSPVEHGDQYGEPERQEEQVVHEPVERAVVPASQAGSEPVAVMVELEDAYSALTAVEGTRRPEYPTCLAELEFEDVALPELTDCQVADGVDGRARV